MKIIPYFLLMASSSFAAVDFDTQIKPIFDKHCIKCHGPEKQKSDLRLDSRESILKGGDLGEPGAHPGHPEKSTIIEFISLDPDDDEIMPPKGDPLTAEQIALISTWIKEGALMPEKKIAKKEKLWSLQQVKKTSIPPGESNPVDAFLAAKLKEKNLQFSQQADPVILLRRLHTVLIGILPSPQEKDTFLAQWVQDSNKAYENKVEELLASPHFGERWAQHWLDAIRWAETSGSESNLYRNRSWEYRDYVVRSFNEDKPYKDFIVDQIAGDKTGYPRATGFMVAGPHVPPATVGQQESAIAEARYDRLDQTLQTVGASMMGMTLGCARCHTHKFDPIKIGDYYAILANFQDLEYGIRKPELPGHTNPAKAEAKYLKLIREHRKTLSLDSWKEMWNDRYEAHIPRNNVTALRITALNGDMAFDEMEVFDQNYKNHMPQAKLSTNLESDKNNVELLRDGEIGYFFAFKGKNKGETPELLIEFNKAIKLQSISFSKDRKAKLNTSYLTPEKWMTELAKYKIEYKTNDGKWHLAIKNTQTEKDVEELNELIAKQLKYGIQYEFLGRFIDPVVTHVLKRGSPNTPGAEVAPNGLAEITPTLNMTSQTPGPERRLTFAKWLANKDNPLTARVMVNRLWYHTFGNGIVSTLSDFGNAGTKPSHPELLDFLANEFVGNNWSTKQMLRTFVLSRAFKQDNKPKVDALRLDAGNRLLWRFAPKRADAEVIRDSILKLSGKLNNKIGGPSYRIHNVKRRYGMWKVEDNYSEKTWRRMLYQERMRGVDDRMFTAFDFPDCGQVVSKRPQSTTPLQALNLMNSQFMINQCNLIADQAQSKDIDESIRTVFMLIYNRQPAEIELAMSRKILKTEKLNILVRALLNSNEFIFIQ
ncbi:PSD1 and planctomycete cytochrome C domain-containing protein [Lentisphaera marina]|uniref:PSD1 and planctomycete cytochrome C domain-containing protein n=1 Tax=Lentisphaera marina TaxID=1111041 RepID=UPI00236537AE|nr:PSD1 and planctomycete cytochrome C domain-containing protein [Lentisphaera marina]MDD7986641.1 PSD1 and planctomycete cytochrome C domain-containing protein [Lentisphaera marina]